MRRLGAFLMIVGANMVVGALAIVLYFSFTACSLSPDCVQGPWALYFDLLFSRDGIPLWIIVLIGAYVFWRGKQMRSSS
ncbi:MAG TPA: hypothetical protein VKZ70_03945 [Burkholderiaceae bacterium]|nr:hypothetical protein [Burkholderiaceae bacterium]